MKKQYYKWTFAVGAIIVITIGLFIGCSGGEQMKAVSEDGRWEAFAVETTVDGVKAWRGVVAYDGDHLEKIKGVRTQACINGVKQKYVKRNLEESGTLGVKRSQAGGKKEFYIFLEGTKEQPASLSAKIKWKENGENCVEKLWLISK